MSRISKFWQFVHEFQIIVEQSIFVVKKHLPYEKASIFDGEYDGTKIKLIA